MSSDVTLIKELLNIIDVVGEYVRLIKAGTYFKARCPFHEEKTPSFVVNEDRQSYHCFGCGVGGDVLSFVMEMEGIDFREALKLLADRAGIELTAYSPLQKEAHDQKSRFYEVMEHAVAFYEQQLWASDSAQVTRTYLAKRGLSDNTLKKFHVGFAPEGWHHLEKFLISKGYALDECVQVGMSITKEHGKQYDRFRGRIMFPIMDNYGRAIGFSARVAPGGDETQAKYINTPETPIYHKSNVLYGIDLAKQAIRRENRVIVVEGNVDVIAAHEAGIENIVAVSGTAMTEAHIKVLNNLASGNVTLFFDADEAGQKAARRSAQTCLAMDIQLSLVSLAHGKDAADLVAEDPELLRVAVANAPDALLHFIAHADAQYDTSDPHQKRQAVEDVLTIAAHIQHPIERDTWIQKVAEHFMITQTIAQEIIQQSQKEQANPERRVPTVAENKEDSPPKRKTQSERLVQLIALLALSFPEAWKILSDESEKYPFSTKHKMLVTLVREGSECEYDVGAFVAKHPEREKLYARTVKFREEYEKTHEENNRAPDVQMRRYLKRSQKLWITKRLAQATEDLRQAERDSDADGKREIMERIAQMTQQL